MIPLTGLAAGGGLLYFVKTQLINLQHTIYAAISDTYTSDTEREQFGYTMLCTFITKYSQPYLDTIYKPSKVLSDVSGKVSDEGSIPYGLFFRKFNGAILKVCHISDKKEGRANVNRLTITIFNPKKHRKGVLDVLNVIYENSKSKFLAVQGSNGLWFKVSKYHNLTVHSELILELQRDIDKFLGEESYYLANNKNWTRTYLLHGPPGTGKSSIIRTVFGKYDKLVFMPNFSSLTAEPLHQDSFILLEDFDRESKKKEYKTGISTLLNYFDGICSPHGSIIFITANDISSLDPALLRPGRVDKIIEVGYLTNEDKRKYLMNKYPDIDTSVFYNKIKDKNLTIAELDYTFCSFQSSFNTDNNSLELTQ